MNYDGNNDGTADWRQDNVASCPTFDGQKYVSMVVPAPVAISGAYVASEPAGSAPLPGIDFVYGVFGFTLNNVGAGSATTLTLILEDGATPFTYYEYGPTPTDPTTHWYEFLYDGETGAVITDNIVTIHFVDGKRGDDDLDDSNGTVIDAGGPGFISTDTSSSSNGNSGCFITSAAYGSAVAPYAKVENR